MATERNQNEAVLAALLGAATIESLRLDVEPPPAPVSLDAIGTLWKSFMSSITGLHHRRLRALAGELTPDLLDLHRQRERDFHQIFLTRSQARIIRDIDLAMALPVDQQLPRLRELVAREKHYCRLHLMAFERRMHRLIEHVSLRMDDPRDDFEGGAHWQLDWSKATHTEDCLIMQGKTWSWQVLRLINPTNRHAFCGCSLEASLVPPMNEIPAGVPTGFDIGEIRAARRDVLGPASVAELMRSI